MGPAPALATTRSDRIPLQLTAYVSGDYVTLPVPGPYFGKVVVLIRWGGCV